MLTAVRLFPALSQRIRILMVAAILALSLTVGMASTTTQVSAMPPQPHLTCMRYSQQFWYYMTGNDPGPSGYIDCWFDAE